MTRQQFGEMLNNRFSNIDPKLLQSIIIWLVGFTEDQIDKIADLFKNSNSARFCPKSLRTFEDIAKDNGIEKQSDNKKVYFKRCDKCGAEFSIVSTGCPVCKSREMSIISADEYPKIIHCKETCWYCKKFSPTRPTIGSKCFDYGEIDNGIQKQGDSVKRIQCGECQCQICCAEEYSIRNHDKSRLLKIQGIEEKDVI